MLYLYCYKKYILQVSASRFQTQFKKDQNITKNFCYDYDEFLLEVNADIQKVVNKLVPFGYRPRMYIIMK